jgi:hypothetical protein
METEKGKRGEEIEERIAERNDRRASLERRKEGTGEMRREKVGER